MDTSEEIINAEDQTNNLLKHNFRENAKIYQ